MFKRVSTFGLIPVLTLATSATAQQNLGTPVHFTVQPGISTRVEVQTVPYGSCVLYSQSQATADNGIDLISDDLGLASFTEPSGFQLEFVLRFK